MGLFDFLYGNPFGYPQGEPFMQGEPSDAAAQQLREYLRASQFDIRSHMRGQEVIKRRMDEAQEAMKKYEHKKETNFTINGECEDITNQRALPKLDGEK